MGVNHGRFDILVAQKGLDFTDVDAVHEGMRRETVTPMCERTPASQCPPSLWLFPQPSGWTFHPCDDA